MKLLRALLFAIACLAIGPAYADGQSDVNGLISTGTNPPTGMQVQLFRMYCITSPATCYPSVYLYNSSGAISITNPLTVQSVSAATGGATQYHLIAAATDNATNVKASAGTVYGVQLAGLGSAPAYLKFYNTNSTPTCASSPLVKTLMIPAASTAANGGGSNVTFPLGVAFTTGISFCVVTGIADNDDNAPAAATYIINFDYK